MCAVRMRGRLWPGLLVLLPCSACCRISATPLSRNQGIRSMTAFDSPAFLFTRDPMPFLTSQLRRVPAGSSFVSGTRMMSASGGGAEYPTPLEKSRLLSIAPMMDYTDRFDRYFLRLISRNALLYTEMVSTGAIIHGDRERHLGFDQAEHPIALQLGGSTPKDLAECSKIGQDYGYDEINLNVGCPSDRVSSGFFGACLMAKPDLVAECVAAMQQAVDIPVTVKHRIGIDDMDSYEELCHFVKTVGSAGSSHFIVHARKAILGGLSPKQNREIPPLKYEVVRDLKRDFPEYSFSLNGGVTSLDQAQEQLKTVDAVMIGRAAYHEPWNVLSKADELIFGDPPRTAGDRPRARQDIVEEMVPFMEAQLAQGVPLNTMTRHMLGLFHGCAGGRQYRRFISDNVRAGMGIEVFLEAVEKVPYEIRMGWICDNPEFERVASALSPRSS